MSRNMFNARKGELKNATNQKYMKLQLRKLKTRLLWDFRLIVLLQDKIDYVIFILLWDLVNFVLSLSLSS